MTTGFLKINKAKVKLTLDQKTYYIRHYLHKYLPNPQK